MAKAKRHEKTYALYRGDEFIDLGTIKELAARRGVSPSTIKYMTMPVHHRRTTYGAMRAYLIEGL
jgi:hypothetical protein